MQDAAGDIFRNGVRITEKEMQADAETDWKTIRNETRRNTELIRLLRSQIGPSLRILRLTYGLTRYYSSCGSRKSAPTRDTREIRRCASSQIGIMSSTLPACRLNSTPCQLPLRVPPFKVRTLHKRDHFL